MPRLFPKLPKSQCLNFSSPAIMIGLFWIFLLFFAAPAPSLFADELAPSTSQPVESTNTNIKDSGQPKLINLAVIVCTEATIIPTAGALDFYKTDFPWIIRQGISVAYPKERFLLIPSEAISMSLKKFGYDAGALEMPEKDDIVSIAADLNADAILVMELSSVGVTVSRTSYQYHAIVRYRAYQAANNRLIIRQFLNEGPHFNNKSTPKEQKDKLVETIRATVQIVLSNCLFGDGWE